MTNKKTEEKETTVQHDIGAGVLVILFIGAFIFVTVFSMTSAFALADKIFNITPSNEVNINYK